MVLLVRTDMESSGYTPTFCVDFLTERLGLPYRSEALTPLPRQEVIFSCPLDQPFAAADSVPSFGVCVKRIRLSSRK